MNTRKTLTHGLSWQDMICLWRKNYTDIFPLSNAMVALHVAILLLSSLALSVTTGLLCDRYTSISPAYQVAIIYIMLTLLICASAIWYICVFVKRRKAATIILLKDADETLEEVPTERVKYWISGFLSERKIRNILVWSDLFNCYILLRESGYLPIHEEDKERFMKHLVILVSKTEELVQELGRGGEGVNIILDKADEYFNFVCEHDENTFENLRQQIRNLR